MMSFLKTSSNPNPNPNPNPAVPETTTTLDTEQSIPNTSRIENILENALFKAIKELEEIIKGELELINDPEQSKIDVIKQYSEYKHIKLCEKQTLQELLMILMQKRKDVVVSKLLNGQTEFTNRDRNKPMQFWRSKLKTVLNLCVKSDGRINPDHAIKIRSNLEYTDLRNQIAKQLDDTTQFLIPHTIKEDEEYIEQNIHN